MPEKLNVVKRYTISPLFYDIEIPASLSFLNHTFQKLLNPIICLCR